MAKVIGKRINCTGPHGPDETQGCEGHRLPLSRIARGDCLDALDPATGMTGAAFLPLARRALVAARCHCLHRSGIRRPGVGFLHITMAEAPTGEGGLHLMHRSSPAIHIHSLLTDKLAQFAVRPRNRTGCPVPATLCSTARSSSRAGRSRARRQIGSPTAVPISREHGLAGVVATYRPGRARTLQGLTP